SSALPQSPVTERVQTALREQPMAIDYEVEYNNRARVPEHPEIFARWTKDAAAYRAEASGEGRAELGVVYGPTPRQFIDLFPPAGTSPPAWSRPIGRRSHRRRRPTWCRPAIRFPACSTSPRLSTCR